MTTPHNDTAQPTDVDLNRAVAAWRSLAPLKYREILLATRQPGPIGLTS